MVIYFIIGLCVHTFCDCKSTTNIWNIQGFSKKNQIYLMFLSKNLVIATCPLHVNYLPATCQLPTRYLSTTCQTRQRDGNDTVTTRQRHGNGSTEHTNRIGGSTFLPPSSRFLLILTLRE